MFKKSDLKGHVKDLEKEINSLFDKAEWWGNLGAGKQAEWVEHEASILRREHITLTELLNKK